MTLPSSNQSSWTRRGSVGSVSTSMALVPMYFFGGPALADFSGPILFGILVGTFSSIYVAAALLLYLPAPAGSIEGGGTAAEATA